jgi:50S ribosomal protein L16 3-hydroxylase
MNTPLTLLNQLTAEQFLAEYWQKKPLLIRQAMPNFAGLLDANELAGLACEDEAQARIIQHQNGTWSVKQGPFKEKDFAKLPERDWTLLVQGVNHFLPEVRDLLAQFNFIPHARLDDLMVSYAPDGGGVGPHVDSYDVFLLQGSGKRHWKISTQTELSLIEGAPLRILKHFNTEQEWVLEAGDMLYLPPQVAHWGLAVGDDCMTYSIGFRAPKTQELAHEFLSYLQDHLPPALNQATLYQDPDLTLQTYPAEISPHMVNKVHAMLKALECNPSLVGDFLGVYLTEPKPHIVFEPAKKLSLNTFKARLATHALYLSLPSQMLFWQQQFYLNGERIALDESIISVMRTLANQRYLDTSDLAEPVLSALAKACYPHYLAGYLTLE